MDQVAQMVGAVVILTAFALNQTGRLVPTSVPYLLMNIVGAAILAVVAAFGRDYGFLLLEGAWALLSIRGLLRRPAYAPPQ